MWTEVTSETKQITDYQFRRVTIDLTHQDIREEAIACQDMEDFLGGIGRAFKLLDEYEVSDAFAPTSPLIMNLGVFSGTDIMTGLRIFFSAYSPLKATNNGQPLAMWSTASGKFATKLAAAGVDEVIFSGRAENPLYLLVRQDDGNLSLTLEPAGDLQGLSTHEKILMLADRYDDSHVAAVGPAGEHWEQNYYGARMACGMGLSSWTNQAISFFQLAHGSYPLLKLKKIPCRSRTGRGSQTPSSNISLHR